MQKSFSRLHGAVFLKGIPKHRAQCFRNTVHSVLETPYTEFQKLRIQRFRNTIHSISETLFTVFQNHRTQSFRNAVYNVSETPFSRRWLHSGRERKKLLQKFVVLSPNPTGYGNIFQWKIRVCETKPLNCGRGRGFPYDRSVTSYDQRHQKRKRKSRQTFSTKYPVSLVISPPGAIPS